MTIVSTRPGLGIIALVLLVASHARVSAEDDNGAAVYKSGLKSACFIYAPNHASGSGSLIDAQKRYVITNNHVVGTSEYVIVHFPMHDAKGKLIVPRDKYIENITSNRGIRGKVLVREETCDLAIIQLDKLPGGVVPVKFASGSPETGEKIHSIGNPGASDAAWVYTPGQVRTVYEKKWTAGGGGGGISNHKAKIIEATSNTSAGDSGGPLFNSKGEQIGVTQGGLNTLKAQGYAYFIDVTEVKNFLKDRKIVLSVRKDEPSPDPMAVELTSDPKTDPDPKPDPKTVVSTGPKKKDPPKVDSAVAEQELLEKKAGTEFALLRGLARDPNKREIAVEKLEALIKKYPKTNVAKEAKELVRKLGQ